MFSKGQLAAVQVVQQLLLYEGGRVGVKPIEKCHSFACLQQLAWGGFRDFIKVTMHCWTEGKTVLISLTTSVSLIRWYCISSSRAC